jgi:hypothetical protein
MTILDWVLRVLGDYIDVVSIDPAGEIKLASGTREPGYKAWNYWEALGVKPKWDIDVCTYQPKPCVEDRIDRNTKVFVTSSKEITLQELYILADVAGDDAESCRQQRFIEDAIAQIYGSVGVTVEQLAERYKSDIPIVSLSILEKVIAQRPSGGDVILGKLRNMRLNGYISDDNTGKEGVDIERYLPHTVDSGNHKVSLLHYHTTIDESVNKRIAGIMLTEMGRILAYQRNKWAQVQSGEISPHEFRPVYIIIDEAQHILNSRRFYNQVKTIFNVYRKFKIGLILLLPHAAELKDEAPMIQCNYVVSFGVAANSREYDLIKKVTGYNYDTDILTTLKNRANDQYPKQAALITPATDQHGTAQVELFFPLETITLKTLPRRHKAELKEEKEEEYNIPTKFDEQRVLEFVKKENKKDKKKGKAGEEDAFGDLRPDSGVPRRKPRIRAEKANEDIGEPPEEPEAEVVKSKLKKPDVTLKPVKMTQIPTSKEEVKPEPVKLKPLTKKEFGVYKIMLKAKKENDAKGQNRLDNIDIQRIGNYKNPVEFTQVIGHIREKGYISGRLGNVVKFNRLDEIIPYIENQDYESFRDKFLV